MELLIERNKSGRYWVHFADRPGAMGSGTFAPTDILRRLSPRLCNFATCNLQLYKNRFIVNMCKFYIIYLQISYKICTFVDTKQIG